MVSRSKSTPPVVATTSSGPQLRERAEAFLRIEADAAESNGNAASDATRLLLHDLRVYQVELEMQNEELRRAQVELDAERGRYFELYDLAPVGYCTINAPGSIVQSNLTAATLVGLPRGSLVKRAFTDFIVRGDQDIFYLCRQRLAVASEPQTCELRMQRADATPFWANIAIAAAQDEFGAPVVRMALTDITANRLAQTDLLESEDRYRNLFNSMDEGYCIIDVIFDAKLRAEDFRVIEVNRAFAKQSGMAGMTGRCVRDAYPELEQAWFDAFGAVALSGEPRRLTGEAKSLDGRWLDVYAFRIGTNGSVRVALIVSDVSQRIHADAERTRMDVTLQAEHVELARAIGVAEKANLAKSDFLSGMSHELRTPLSAILGFAQLIESGSPPPTPSQQRSIEQILRSGWYLLDLINEILDLAVVESGKMTLSLEPIALKDIIAECLTMVDGQAQQREVSVSFAAFEKHCMVIADWTRLKQVMLNILSNAIKYNKPGGQVTVAFSEPSPGRVRVSISDSGEGLNADKIAQLFQPFNRLGRESGFVEGTGIGLVVSKRLIELMGGVIGVESTPGRGSVFWIELTETVRAPLSAAQAKNAGIFAHSAVAGATVGTILYVEDNPANLMLVEELVARRNDLRLISARDGHRGVEMARLALPDVILMDINLPGISGTQALARLSADPTTACIPIIALSANAMARDIEKGLAAGFFRYLTKPIKVNEFMETLDSALEFARAHPGRNAARGDDC